MNAIEDIVQNVNKISKFPIAYDIEIYKKLIDDFVIDNLELTSWSKLEYQIRKFQKIHKIELRKMDLISSYKHLKLNKPSFYNIIQKKSMRSQSGVLVCTVFTSGHPEFIDKNGKKQKQMFSCKHNCYFCPNEPGHEGNNWTQQPRSYLTKEPGVLRANLANYDCVQQMYLRINQYIKMGHNIDKLEVLVLGGTFSEYPSEYQIEFVRDIYYAANTAISFQRSERFPLELEILLNETEKIRIIGLTLETRPDTIDLNEIKKFRSFGTTRLQMGVQHTNNKLLKLSNRGHTIERSIQAIELLKNNGYKVDIHLMPNLFGSSPTKDIEMFKQILYNQHLQADQIKLYPVSVVPWSVYEKMYQNGKYKPYPDDILKTVLIYAKTKMHPWIRLNRVIRDIPLAYINGGCSEPNMRQSLSKLSNCQCIRCRELKHRDINSNDIFRKIRIYKASNGIEIFISYESENEKIIYGFLRLRIQKYNNIEVFEELKNTALIRELHVYGKLSVVGKNNGTQHFGIGSSLLKDAEQFAIIYGFRKLSVISGIGVRQYYRKRGYNITTKNGYLQKKLSIFLIIFNICKIFLEIFLKIFCTKNFIKKHYKAIYKNIYICKKIS